MVAFAKLVLVIAARSRLRQVRWVDVEESLAPVIPGQDCAPVFALDLDVAEAVVNGWQLFDPGLTSSSERN